MTAIDYSSGSRVTAVGGHTVYTKASWAGTWTAQPNLTCIECAWNAAPDFNSALLVWHTGDIIMPGDTLPTTYGPWVGRGQFVRIDWVCDDSSILRWVGYIDSSSWPTEAFGNQHLVCYGLERSLAMSPIVEVAWKDGSTVRRSQDLVPFNEPPNGGKSAAAISSVYLFSKLVTEPMSYWSTKDIVKYLLTYHLPTNTSGVASIPWALDQASLIPDWDKPLVEIRGRTVWDILNELLGPDRQLGFTFGSNGSTAYIRVFTHTASDITVGSHTLTANPNQHTLTLAPDALTQAQLTDVGGGYDQVVCRGARRVSICSLKYLDHIENGWTSTNETKYETGASADAGYSALNTDKQRLANAAIRAQTKVSDVYRRFLVKSTWDNKIGSEEVFPGNLNPRSLKLISNLPIKKDIDWSGSVDQANFDPTSPSPAGIQFGDPDDLTRWVDVRTVGIGGDVTAQGRRPHDLLVSAETRNREILVRINGGPNHAIAGTNFTKLPVDDRDYGGLDYSTMKITLAIEEDRYCEGKYPSTPPSVDVVRRLILEFGDAYEQVYIVPDTVAYIKSDGTEAKSNGGYLQDDTDKLETLAQIVALGAVLTRKRVAWSSSRRISAIAVGDMIVTAEGATVNSPITSIRISAPETSNTPAQSIRQSFETFRGTQDPLSVLRRLGVTF